MNKYKWSAKYNAFFPIEMLHAYQSSWDDLSDLIDINDTVEAEFNGEPPEGKVRGVVDNMPAWVSAPPPTKVELIADAEAEKQHLIAQANAYMNSKQWPGKAAMGRLKDEEKVQYITWLDYLDALEAVDTSSAPDINWPVPPEV
ncbi:tail fiber assembly protein [Citrobacter amalonaticus]|nr:tail fiber assembly protein [Citrobacter amalonaticus]HCB1891957.1 tail fiber assembly protein [Citrobacter amalonaticus]HCB1914006.1 tail fiber assembly protein [Citrobacter amalonaticus]